SCEKRGRSLWEPSPCFLPRQHSSANKRHSSTIEGYILQRSVTEPFSAYFLHIPLYLPCRCLGELFLAYREPEYALVQRHLFVDVPYFGIDDPEDLVLRHFCLAKPFSYHIHGRDDHSVYEGFFRSLVFLAVNHR